MSKIYVIRKGKHLLGPYNFEELAAVGLETTDVIWYEASKDYHYDISDFEHLMIKKKSSIAIQKLFGRRFIRRRIIFKRNLDRTLNFLQARITSLL